MRLVISSPSLVWVCSGFWAPVFPQVKVKVRPCICQAMPGQAVCMSGHLYYSAPKKRRNYKHESLSPGAAVITLPYDLQQRPRSPSGALAGPFSGPQKNKHKHKTQNTKHKTQTQNTKHKTQNTKAPKKQNTFFWEFFKDRRLDGK